MSRWSVRVEVVSLQRCTIPPLAPRSVRPLIRPTVHIRSLPSGMDSSPRSRCIRARQHTWQRGASSSSCHRRRVRSSQVIQRLPRTWSARSTGLLHKVPMLPPRGLVPCLRIVAAQLDIQWVAVALCLLPSKIRASMHWFQWRPPTRIRHRLRPPPPCAAPLA